MKFSDLDIHAFGNTINLTGAIYAGEGHTFLCFFPKDKPEGQIEPLELDRNEWDKLLRQLDTLETEVQAKASDGALAKVILRKSQRQISTLLSWRVFRRDAYRCRYCGNDDVPLTVDHLVLWEEGGPTTEENLVSACKKCNGIRGKLDYAAWLKHPHYRTVSKNLDEMTRRENEALVRTLASIPRMLHIPTR